MQHMHAQQSWAVLVVSTINNPAVLHGQGSMTPVTQAVTDVQIACRQAMPWATEHMVLTDCAIATHSIAAAYARTHITALNTSLAVLCYAVLPAL
jgi:hypothetical protein